MLSYSVPADGYAADVHGQASGAMVKVNLSRERQAIEQEISVAGCDPAIFLVGAHLRQRKDQTSVVGWTMGSMAALRALQQGEVHVAGLHLFDPTTGESNLPFLRRALKGSNYQKEDGRTSLRVTALRRPAIPSRRPSTRYTLMTVESGLIPA